MPAITVYRNIFVSLLLLLPGSILWSQEPASWTHFRGSELNGITREKGFPDHWDDSLNIAWMLPESGKGWSSPVVYGKQVWFTTAIVERREMRAICVDLRTGEKLHDRLIFQPAELFRIHTVNSYATPTPAIEEGFVYLHFGRYGTTCLNSSTGETVWERTDLLCEHVQGPGSSLFLYRDKLIVHLEGTDVQQILALDKKTGETLWISERPADLYAQMPHIGKKAYITPVILNVKGRDLLISNGSGVCMALDPETGREIWRIVQGDDSTISMPVAGDGLVFFYTSFVTGIDGVKYAELFAVDPDGKGDIGATHIRWRMKAPILQLSTPVYVDGLLYTVDSKGVFYCLDARTGKVHWSENLKGKFHSSPVYADGLLYISSTRGETFVFREGPRPELLAKNVLQGEIWATPAFTGGAILMRTSKYLYKIVRKEVRAKESL
ncbi:MAG: PQQ-binding-like beta-propeller repeat protein [Bacteroidales bacterium]|nr:PQQ-binding-like beta-propeller repeat protein [Bacteroidales bacterium]